MVVLFCLHDGKTQRCLQVEKTSRWQAMIESLSPNWQKKEGAESWAQVDGSPGERERPNFLRNWQGRKVGGKAGKQRGKGVPGRTHQRPQFFQGNMASVEGEEGVGLES